MTLNHSQNTLIHSQSKVRLLGNNQIMNDLFDHLKKMMIDASYCVLASIEPQFQAFHSIIKERNQKKESERLIFTLREKLMMDLKV